MFFSLVFVSFLIAILVLASIVLKKIEDVQDDLSKHVSNPLGSEEDTRGNEQNHTVLDFVNTNSSSSVDVLATLKNKNGLTGAQITNFFRTSSTDYFLNIVALSYDTNVVSMEVKTNTNQTFIESWNKDGIEYTFTQNGTEKKGYAYSFNVLRGNLTGDVISWVMKGNANFRLEFYYPA